MLSYMDSILQERFEQFSTINIVEALEVLYHKETTKVHEMTEAMEQCKIAEVGEQGVRLADYYGSIIAMGIDFPKTPENDFILTSLYEGMIKTNEFRMHNQQVAGEQNRKFQEEMQHKEQQGWGIL